MVANTDGLHTDLGGIAAAPVGFCHFFLRRIIGHYMGKIDLRMLMCFGFIAFAISAFWRSNYYTPLVTQLIQPRLMQGFGITFFFTPLVTIIIAGLPRERIASALGLSNFCGS